MVIPYDEIVYHLGKKRLAYTHKEALEIYSHHISVLSVILTHVSDILLKLLDAGQLTLSFPAVICTIRKLRLKQWFESQCDIVMDNAVTKLTSEHFAVARVSDNKADRFADLILT
jgi:hypothetical protein